MKLADIRKTFNSYWQVYKTDQFLRLYHKEKYKSIIKNFSSFKKYENVKINEYNMIFFAISEQNNEFIKQFLEKIKYKDQVLNDQNNPNNFFPLTFASLNNLPEIRDLLVENQANIFSPNEKLNTLLHISAFYNNLPTLQYTLDQNFDLNAQNSDGNTALHLAAINKHLDVVKLLLENNASSNLKNSKGHYPIHEAIIVGDVEIVKLLESSLTKINDAIFTPVHLAAQHESIDLLHYFTDGMPQKISVQDKYLATPLHYAVISNAVESARYLLENRVSLNSQDKNGNTALHLAVLNKNNQMIQLLSDYKADAGVINKDNLSPIDLCYQDRDISLINYFRSQTHYVEHFRLGKAYER